MTVAGATLLFVTISQLDENVAGMRVIRTVLIRNRCQSLFVEFFRFVVVAVFQTHFRLFDQLFPREYVRQRIHSEVVVSVKFQRRKMHEMVMHAPVALKSLYQIRINVDTTIDPHCESVLTIPQK